MDKSAVTSLCITFSVGNSCLLNQAERGTNKLLLSQTLSVHVGGRTLPPLWFDIPFEWLTRPDYSDELVRSKARIEAMLRHYVTTYEPKAMSEIIDECIASLSLTHDQSLTPEQQAELTKLINYRLAHYVMNLPYVEPLSLERSAQKISWVRSKSPGGTLGV